MSLDKVIVSTVGVQLLLRGISEDGLHSLKLGARLGGCLWVTHNLTHRPPGGQETALMPGLPSDVTASETDSKK